MLLVTLAASVATVDLCPTDGCADFSSDASLHDLCHQTGFTNTDHFASTLYKDGDEPYVLAVRLVHAGADYRFLYCTRKLPGGIWTHRVSGTVLDYEPYAPVVDDDVFPMIRRQRFRVASSDVFSCPSNLDALCGSSARTLTAVVTFLEHDATKSFPLLYRALVDNIDLNLGVGGTLELRRVHELGDCNSHFNVCTDGFNAAISPSGVHVAVVKPTLMFPGSFSAVRANTAGFTLYTSTSYGRRYEGSNNDKRHGDLFHNELEFSPDALPFLSSRSFAPLVAVDVAFESEDGTAANYLVWFRKYARLFKYKGSDAMDRDNYDFSAALGSGHVSSNKLRSSEDIDSHSDNLLRIAYPISVVGKPTRTKHNTAAQLTAFYRFDHGTYSRYEFDGLRNGFPAMFRDLFQFYLARGDHHNGVTTGGLDFKGANGGLVSTARYAGSAWQSTAYAWHKQYYAQEPAAPASIRPAPSEEFLKTESSPFFQKRLILVGRFAGSKICSIVPTRAMLGTDGKRPAIAECTTDGSDYSLHVANYAAEPTTTATTRTATTVTTVTTTTVTIVDPAVKCAEADRFELNSAAVAGLRATLLNDDPGNTDIDLVKKQAGGSFFFLEFFSLQSCNEAAAEMNRVFCLRGPQTLECPSSNNNAPILRYRDCGDEAFESNYTAMTSGVCPTTTTTTTTVTTTTEANCTMFDGFFVNKATNRCEQCPEGTYVPTTDERFNINFDSCFEQRGCAVGHVELVPGTSVHPPICGDPHDSQHCNATTEFHIGNLTDEGGEWRMKCAVAGTCPFETDVANVEEGTIENAVARYAEAVIDRTDFESLRQFGSTHAGANHNVTVDGHPDVHFIRLCEPLTVCEPFNPDPPPEIGVFNTYEAVPPRPDADRICLPCPSLCANESSADFPSIAGEFTPTRDVCTFSTTQNAPTCSITADSVNGFFGFGGRACSAIKSDPRHPGGFCRDHEARTITTSTKTTATLTTSRPNPCNAGRFRSIEHDSGCHDCAPGRYTPFDGRDYLSCLERRRCKVAAGREAEELKGPVVSPRRIVHDGGRLNYLCERPLEASCAENEFRVSVQEEAGELLQLCQVVRRCYPGQYVSKQPTATSDRECRNCTLCRSYTTTHNADRCIEIEQPTTPGDERSGCRLDTPFASVGPPTRTTATSTTATATTMVAKFMMTVAARFPVDPRDDGRTECDAESPHTKTVLRQKAATAFEAWALKSGAPFPVVASVVLTCEPGIVEFTFFVRNPASEFPAFAAAATSPVSPQLYVDHSGLLGSELYAETITVTDIKSKSVATATRNIIAPRKVSKFKKTNEGLAWVGFAALGLFVAGAAVLYVQLRDGQRAMLVKTLKSSFA